MERHCIKCHHTHPHATGDELEACPACGAIYSKARPTLPRSTRPGALAAAAAPAVRADEAPQQPPPQPQPQPAASALARWQGYAIVAAVLYGLWYLTFGGPTEAERLADEQRAMERVQAHQERERLEQQQAVLQAAARLVQARIDTARQAERRFEIASRSGSPMDACVQAGFARAAWLQAQIEAQYKRWTEIEQLHCAAAGVRR